MFHFKFTKTKKIIVFFYITFIVHFIFFCRRFFHSHTQFVFFFIRWLFRGTELCVLHLCCLQSQTHINIYLYVYMYISITKIDSIFHCIYSPQIQKERKKLQMKKRKCWIANSTYTLHCHKKGTIFFNSFNLHFSSLRLISNSTENFIDGNEL